MATLGCPDLRMTMEEYQLFNEYISAHYGITFPEHKREILESRLKPRIEALKLRNFMNYYVQLQFNNNGAKEKDILLEMITNNETYFFREIHQFEALFRRALGDLKPSLAAPGEIRILCAGCSSGEEPYTLRIFAKENQYLMWGYNTVIDAFDIDRSKVRMAEAAEYTSNSVRMLTEEQLRQYFISRGRSYVLKPFYRDGISFGVGNILDPSTYAKPFPYDVIFCRNVLIYFSEPALHTAIENFARILRPGGLLFLGHSESIIGISPSFESVRLDNCIAYRRVRPCAG